MDFQRFFWCFLEVFGSAWGAPVPKRAQRASEASARSDSARAVMKSRLVLSLSSRRLFVSSCFVSSRLGSSRLAASCGFLLILTRFPFFADSGLFFTVFWLNFSLFFWYGFCSLFGRFWSHFGSHFRSIFVTVFDQKNSLLFDRFFIDFWMDFGSQNLWK